MGGMKTQEGRRREEEKWNGRVGEGEKGRKKDAGRKTQDAGEQKNV